MGNKSLQELSRQYADGKLNKPEYRQQRTELINEITGNQTQEGSRIAETPSQQPVSDRSNGTSDPQLKYVLIIVLLLTAILVFYISSSGNEHQKTSAITNYFNASQNFIQQATHQMTPIAGTTLRKDHELA